MISFFKEKVRTLHEELSSYTSREKAFIFFAMMCGFFICCEYSAIRPVSSSLFIYSYGTRYLPYAWLALVPFNFLAVSVYNKLLPRWGSKKIFMVLVGLVMCSNTLAAIYCKKFAAVPFLFYMWKEIYVLLMFQLVWSVIHANVKFSKAKYLYGIFFGVGGLGSMLGVSFPSFLAVSHGSENLIFLSMPIYCILLLFYLKMNKFCSGEVPHHEKHEHGGVLHGMKLIRGSRFLIFALLIVMFMQMITATVDFQFNDFLERTFLDKDVRTEYAARVLGIVHTLTVALQFLGTYLLVKWVGFKRVHYLMPAILGTSICLFAIFPVFSMAAAMFVACKGIDFSIFGAIKEMLYVPLKSDEKFRAKAVIDIFVYRSSKALASILIIGITTYFSAQALTWINITLAILWAASVSYGLREYEKVVEPA